MKAKWDSYPGIAKDLVRVRAAIEEALTTRNPLLSEALKKLVSRNGKMLRPAFVLLAARMKPCRGGPFPQGRVLPEKIYRIAAAVEIMHMATLVHDDVIDSAETRRGRPSVNADYGNRRAILLGDFLFSLCFSLVADHATMENARFLARGVSAICGSEIAQSRRYDPSTLSIRDYLHRIIGKTAVLFSLSFHVGASENGLSSRHCTILRRIGYDVGMSFQITDDLLDFVGDAAVLGKPAGNDLRDGIFTLPLIHAYGLDSAGLGPLLTREKLADPKTVKKITKRIDALGGFERAERMSELYGNRAVLEASHLPDNENRSVLIEVVESLRNRKF